MRALIAAALCVACVSVAYGHDIYMSVKRNGIPCCGGDPVTGDCEALTDEQIKVNPDGSAEMYSKRYKRWIAVAGSVIEWNTVPGDKPEDAGHICAKPYAMTALGKDTSQIDPDYFVFCAFVKPGGV